MSTAGKEIHALQGRRTTRGNEPRDMKPWDVERPAEEHQAALNRIREGGIATKVRILINHDACLVCFAIEGAYDFDAVPGLPPEGCSRVGGCNAYYAPVLDRRGP